MKPENWVWDGKQLWHRGDGYEGDNQHRYVGVEVTWILEYSKQLEYDKYLITQAPLMAKAIHDFMMSDGTDKDDALVYMYKLNKDLLALREELGLE